MKSVMQIVRKAMMTVIGLIDATAACVGRGVDTLSQRGEEWVGNAKVNAEGRAKSRAQKEHAIYCQKMAESGELKNWLFENLSEEERRTLSDDLRTPPESSGTTAGSTP